MQNNSDYSNLADLLIKNGYVLTESFLEQNTINKFIEEAKIQIKNNKKSKFSNKKLYKNSNLFKDFILSNQFSIIQDNIFFNHKQRDKENIYYVFSYEKTKFNSNEKKEKIHRFHFDGFSYTIIIPINLDNDLNKVDTTIYIFPYLRIYLKKIIFFNFIIKFLIQNFFINNIIHYFISKKIIIPKKITVKKNQILIFNGYNCLHAGISINQNNTKSRLIVHLYLDEKISFIEKYLNKRNRVL